MLPGMYLLGKQLTKKTSIATFACLFMTFDCMHLTQTQIATIDSFPVLFIIFAYFFLLRFLQTDILKQRIIQPKMGMLCHGRIFAPHLGQCDAGKAMFMPRGIRYAKTFKKLPTTEPMQPIQNRKKTYNPNGIYSSNGMGF